MLRGANMVLKELFRMLLNCFFFYHNQSRALFCLQHKGVAQSILKDFGFHEYDDEHEKVFITFCTLQNNFCDSVHVEWLLGP